MRTTAVAAVALAAALVAIASAMPLQGSGMLSTAMSKDQLVAAITRVRVQIVMDEPPQWELALDFMRKLGNILERASIDAETIAWINDIIAELASSSASSTEAPPSTAPPTADPASSSSSSTSAPTTAPTTVNVSVVGEAYTTTIYPNVWLYGGGGLPVVVMANASSATSSQLKCADLCFNTKLCTMFSYYLSNGNWTCALKIASTPAFLMLPALDYGFANDTIFAGAVVPMVPQNNLPTTSNVTLTTALFSVEIFPDTWIDGGGWIPTTNFPANATASAAYLLQCATLCYNTEGCYGITYYLSDNAWVCGRKDSTTPVVVYPALPNGFLPGAIYAGFINTTRSAANITVNTTLATDDFTVAVYPNVWFYGGDGLGTITFPADTTPTAASLLKCANICYETAPCFGISFYLSNGAWVCDLKQPSSISMLPSSANSFPPLSIFAGVLTVIHTTVQPAFTKTTTFTEASFTVTVQPDVWFWGGDGLGEIFLGPSSNVNATLQQCGQTCYNILPCYGFTLFLLNGSWVCGLKQPAIGNTMLPALTNNWPQSGMVYAGVLTFTTPAIDVLIPGNTSVATDSFVLDVFPGVWFYGGDGLGVTQLPSNATGSLASVLQCATICYNTAKCYGISYYISDNSWMCALKVQAGMTALPAAAYSFQPGTVIAGVLAPRS